MEHTINQRSDDAYHVNVIWKQLKLNLDAIFAAMYDEITSTFDDNVPAVSGTVLFDRVARIHAQFYPHRMECISCV